MKSEIYSAAVGGVEAFEVEIQVDAGWVTPTRSRWSGCRTRAGDARSGARMKESRDRVTSAIGNSGLRWLGGQRITINLAPADVRKKGPSFDLPIALRMLKLEENNWLPDLDGFYLTGELALSGQLRPAPTQRAGKKKVRDQGTP